MILSGEHARSHDMLVTTPELTPPLFSLYSFHFIAITITVPCCTVIVIALLGQFPPRVIIIFLSLHVLPPVSQNSSEARSLS